MAHDELDTKAFELVFSLTIVVWLLDLSKDLPTKYEAIGWLTTLIMVILFCLIVQHTTKVNSNTIKEYPHLTKQDEKHSHEVQNYIIFGNIILLYFLLLATYLNCWHINKFSEFNYSFLAKYVVLVLGWSLSASTDSFIYNIMTKDISIWRIHK